MFGHNNNHSDIVQVSQRWGTDETKWTGFDNNQSKALRHCRISTTWYHLRFCKISPIIRYLTKSSSSLTLTVIAFPWTWLPARSRQPALKKWIFFYKCNMPCRNIECSSRKSWSKQQLLSLKELPSHFWTRIRLRCQMYLPYLRHSIFACLCRKCVYLANPI